MKNKIKNKYIYLSHNNKLFKFMFNILSFQGCYQSVMNWAMSHLNIIIGVGIGLALLELLGIFLAFCLTKNINSYIK